MECHSSPRTGVASRIWVMRYLLRDRYHSPTIGAALEGSEVHQGSEYLLPLRFCSRWPGPSFAQMVAPFDRASAQWAREAAPRSRRPRALTQRAHCRSSQSSFRRIFLWSHVVGRPTRDISPSREVCHAERGCSWYGSGYARVGTEGAHLLQAREPRQMTREDPTWSYHISNICSKRTGY